MPKSSGYHDDNFGLQGYLAVYSGDTICVMIC
jgi:hypothetical protein